MSEGVEAVPDAILILQLEERGGTVSMAKALVVIGGAIALSACAMQLAPLYSGQLQLQGAQPEQALVSSPALPGERQEYHQTYVQSEIARYHQAIQLCNQMQATGTLGSNNGRYRDCVSEAREQFQWDQENERRFAAKDAVAQAQAPAEGQALKAGQMTPLMLQLCHAFGIYGPQNCAKAYPSIAAHLQ
jgi:hypothetical protein